MFFSIKPKNIKTTLDLGTHQMKVVQIQSIDPDGVINLTNYQIGPSTTDFAVSTYIEGPIIDPLAVEVAIKSLISGMGFTYDPIFTLLPDHISLTTILNTPLDAQPPQVVSAVIEEFSPILQVPVECWNFHGYPLGSDEGERLVLGLGILKKNLLEIGEIIQKANLNPQIMDISTPNLFNLLEFYLKHPENAGKNIAIVNLGNETTTVGVFQDGDLKTFANKSIGGYDFSRQIAEHFHVSESDADEFKKNETFFLDEFVAEQDDLYNYNVIRGVFGELVKEIFGVLEQFLIKTREFTVNEVIIAGGGANFKNIWVVLEGNLNTRVIQAANLLKIQKNNVELSNEEKNILAPALGAFFRD